MTQLSPTPIKNALQSPVPIEPVRVQGWVRTRRDSKDFSFIELNDGSSLRNLQIIAKKDALPNYADIQRLNTGASLLWRARWSRRRAKDRNGSSSREISKLSVAPTKVIRSKKRGTRRNFCARSRICVHGRIFSVACSVCVAGSRSPFTSFFRIAVSFTFIHPSSPEAIAKAPASCFGFQPSTSRIRRRKTARSITRRIFSHAKLISPSVDSWKRRRSPARLAKVYTFGPTFRAENSNTSRHASEFWMIEPEMAFCDLTGNMDLAEELVKYLIADARKQCAEELELFAKFVDKELLARLDFVD